MSKNEWIDAETYFGPERRAGGSGLRIFDRRRELGARTAPPALLTVLRQLKSASIGLNGTSQWSRFLVRVEGAVGLATLQGQNACAAELTRLLNALKRTPLGRFAQSDIEAALERAATTLPR